MSEDFAEIRGMVRKVRRAALAEADAVALASPFQNHLAIFFMSREIVARNGVPAESPTNR